MMDELRGTPENDHKNILHWSVEKTYFRPSIYYFFIYLRESRVRKRKDESQTETGDWANRGVDVGDV